MNGKNTDSICSISAKIVGGGGRAAQANRATHQPVPGEWRYRGKLIVRGRRQIDHYPLISLPCSRLYISPWITRASNGSLKRAYRYGSTDTGFLSRWREWSWFSSGTTPVNTEPWRRKDIQGSCPTGGWCRLLRRCWTGCNEAQL